jgi:hypothetical protein
MRTDSHVRDLLAHYFVAPRAALDKYRAELLIWNSFQWVDLSPDLVLLCATFADESSQERFAAEPGVLTLPHFSSGGPLSPTVAAKLAEFEEWRTAPTHSIDDFVEWVCSNRMMFGSEIHRAQLRIKRHAAAKH